MKTPEEGPRQEILEETVIEILKKYGLDNFEAMTLLDKWSAQEEVIADKAPTKESNVIAHINLDRKRARLYFAAGFNFQGIVSLKQAAWQALGAGYTEST